MEQIALEFDDQFRCRRQVSRRTHGIDLCGIVSPTGKSLPAASLLDQSSVCASSTIPVTIYHSKRVWKGGNWKQLPVPDHAWPLRKPFRTVANIGRRDQSRSKSAPIVTNLRASRRRATKRLVQGWHTHDAPGMECGSIASEVHRRLVELEPNTGLKVIVCLAHIVLWLRGCRGEGEEEDSPRTTDTCSSRSGKVLGNSTSRSSVVQQLNISGISGSSPYLLTSEKKDRGTMVARALVDWLKRL